ncbi:MAG: hypothetical protein ACKVWV_19645 [Planctomycetota bacterium]
MTAAWWFATWMMLATRSPQPQTLGDAIQDANAGKFAMAWTIGSTLASPLERTQARVYVLAHAGQLRAALAETNGGIALGLHDPWLLERSCALAISLREPELAQQRIRELSRFVERQDGGGTWGPAVAEHEPRLAELVERRRALSGASVRARTCVAVLGGLLLSVLGMASRLGGRGSRKGPP